MVCYGFKCIFLAISVKQIESVVCKKKTHIDLCVFTKRDSRVFVRQTGGYLVSRKLLDFFIQRFIPYLLKYFRTNYYSLSFFTLGGRAETRDHGRRSIYCQLGGVHLLLEFSARRVGILRDTSIKRRKRERI